MVDEGLLVLILVLIEIVLLAVNVVGFLLVVLIWFQVDGLLHFPAALLLRYYFRLLNLQMLQFGLIDAITVCEDLVQIDV